MENTRRNPYARRLATAIAVPLAVAGLATIIGVRACEEIPRPQDYANLPKMNVKVRAGDCVKTLTARYVDTSVYTYDIREAQYPKDNANSPSMNLHPNETRAVRYDPIYLENKARKAN